MPLGHVGLNLPDRAAARADDDAVMPLLDDEPFVCDDGAWPLAYACVRSD